MRSTNVTSTLSYPRVCAVSNRCPLLVLHQFKMNLCYAEDDQLTWFILAIVTVQYNTVIRNLVSLNLDLLHLRALLRALNITPYTPSLRHLAEQN